MGPPPMFGPVPPGCPPCPPQGWQGQGAPAMFRRIRRRHHARAR
jgi:hypothetical protein